MMTTLKKSLALLLSVALLITALVVPMAVSAETGETNIWDGGQVQPSDTNGDGVYEINTPEELAWAVNNSGGKSYILTTDIYLNDLAAVNWATGEVKAGFEPIEWFENVSFKGTFDGNGHIVYGIYYPVGNNADIDYNCPVALFPSVGTNTTIKNVGVKMSYLETKGFAGAIVGYFGDIADRNFTVDNCFSDSTVTLKAKQPVTGNYQFGAGGIIGAFYNSNIVTVTNCYSSAKTSAINVYNVAETRAYKIVGDMWLAASDWQTRYNNLVMKNCYAVGGAPCPAKANAAFTTFENVYSTAAAVATYGPWTQVSEANMKGAAALTNMPGLADAFCTTIGLPVLKVFVTGTAGGTWTGLKDDQIIGEGTKESPYLIYTAEQLAYAVNTTTNKVYQLQNDIVLNDITVEIEDGVGVIYDANNNKVEDTSKLNTWVSGSFPGTIDGNGHVVRGMFFKGENQGTEAAWQRNFAFIKNAAGTTVIENLGIEDSYVSYTKGTAAGFVGYLQASAAIVRNSYLGDSVYLEGQCVGGIFGSGDMCNFGPNCVENCYVLATINPSGTRWGALYAETWNRGLNTKNMSVKNVYSSMRLADGLSGVLANTCYGDVKAENGRIGSILDGNTMYLGNAFNYVEGGLPVLKVFDDRDMVWGGLGGFVYAGGTGTEEDPYLVSDPAQLAYMVYSGGKDKYYKLTNDIVVTDLDAVNWATGEVKEGLDYAPVYWFGGTDNQGCSYKTETSTVGYFKGRVDGNGYKVSGIYYEPYYTGRDIETEGKWYTCAGLIPATQESTISNIMLSDSYISGGRFSGGFSGYSKNSTYTNLLADNTVNVVSGNVGIENGNLNDKKEFVKFESTSSAGIIGYAVGTVNMDNCGTSAKITSLSHLHGLIGTQWATTVNLTNSFSVGYSPMAKAGGGGTNNITNVYGDVIKTETDTAVTKLETAQITGKAALDNMPGVDTDFWYGVEGQGPLFRSYGERIVDISCDGKFELNAEATALRVAIITNTVAPFADRNEDTFIDIIDLVTLVK